MSGNSAILPTIFSGQIKARDRKKNRAPTLCKFGHNLKIFQIPLSLKTKKLTLSNFFFFYLSLFTFFLLCTQNITLTKMPKRKHLTNDNEDIVEASSSASQRETQFTNRVSRPPTNISENDTNTLLTGSPDSNQYVASLAIGDDG